jgi:hypothetical protein
MPSAIGLRQTLPVQTNRIVFIYLKKGSLTWGSACQSSTAISIRLSALLNYGWNPHFVSHFVCRFGKTPERK